MASFTDTDFSLSMFAGELLAEARTARARAYAPYSDFKVGAALMTADGTVISGCNVENQSFGATMCAERVAIFAAVASGKLTPEKPPVALAVTAQPCAMCLQVLGEFVGADFPIILSDGEQGDFAIYRFGELLPRRFEM